MSGFELVQTASGQPALRDLATGEVMHPNGPALEAERLYVEPSRLRARADAVVLDVGLGAGSNALAALHAGAGRVVSFERTLAPVRFALAHATAFGFSDEDRHQLEQMLAGAHPRWQLRLGELEHELAVLDERADVVFWDPYSPRTQPTLWGVRTFASLRRACRAGATVHTYSAATSVRAAFLLSGFAVGFGPGVGAKQKRSTIAALTRDDLREPLERSWLLGVGPSALPIDAPPDALARLRAAAQFA